MNDYAHPKASPEDVAKRIISPYKLFKGFQSVTPYIPGRRPFFKYRDLGVKTATGGKARANKSDSIASMASSISQVWARICVPMIRALIRYSSLWMVTR